MNILITGSEGFVGSNIVANLYRHDIITLDKKSDSGLNIDLTRPFNINSELDVIIHEASVTDTTKDYKIISQNVSMFINVLKLALEKNAELIYASSAAVYGNGKVPMEESQKLNPLNPYAQSKAIIDYIARKYMNEIKIVGLRYFNIFGAGEQHKGKSASMIYQLRNQILSGQKPKLFKYGEQLRDHIYIKDIVNVTNKAMKIKKSGIYNIGTGVATSWNDLLLLINNTLNTDAKPLYIDNPYQAYQNYTKASITLAKKELHWTPKWKLKNAIKNYFKQI